MAKPRKKEQVDLSESSVYRDNTPNPPMGRPEDLATDAELDRLEAITGGADEPAIVDGELGQKFDELDASTEEELDALEVNLVQEDERPNVRDGSGLIVDDSAEEQLARFTEADPMLSDLGAVSVAPGSDDTSAVLRRHYPNPSIAGSDAVVEGNLDEPMGETILERKIDEGTPG
ncbi:MAG: hypothetical protein WA354_21165 [Terracidiphilus sp.]